MDELDYAGGLAGPEAGPEGQPDAGEAMEHGGGLLPVPISALEHFSYCPRQCALIHLEQSFAHNVLTVRGTLAHERVEQSGDEWQGGVLIRRSILLWHDGLGLSGKADVVEFRPDGAVYPVEYKHGRRHKRIHDDLQVCAQALCLEQMLGVAVPRGAVYHHSSRRRREVEFTPGLRQQVAATTAQVRAMLLGGATPPPVADGRCRNCSQAGHCLPRPICLTDWEERWRELFAVRDPGGVQ
jgi:CRISPR-associated exonuclease Cas4